MSNLIKSVYFNVDHQDTRVIDSDERVEEFIPEIFEEHKNVEDDFQPLDSLALPSGEQKEQNFEDGLSVISMDDVMNQEREKIQSELQKEQDELLANAKKEAEEIVEQAKAEAEALQQQAYEEGVQSGLAEGRAKADEEIERRRNELSEEYQQRFSDLEEQEKSLEPAFANLVVSLVKKITGISCENKKDVILYLIGCAMRNFEKTSRITIRVSKADMSRVSAKKSTLKAIAKDEAELDVVEDNSLKEMQCIIETDYAIIDCSLDAQLQNLEEHMKLLLY